MTVALEKNIYRYYGLSTDTKPTSVPVGSTFFAYDTKVLYKTYDGTNYAAYSGGGWGTKTSASPLTTGTLFNYTGSVQLLAVIGRVSTVIQTQATTVKLSGKPDSLAAVDLCATLDINAFGAGSLLGLTGYLADAMTGTTVVGVLQGQSIPIVLTCVTAGIITVTYGAASTGAIVWEVLWVPLSANGTVTAA